MTDYSEADQFFAQGAPAPERVNGRYALADPVTGEARTWQTASNYAYPLIDQFGLTIWRQRQLLIGLAQRPDLMAMLAAAVEPDNGKLDEVIKTAMEVAGVTRSANMGTAVHSALEAADLGLAWPDMFNGHVAAYRQALAEQGLKVVACESKVINRSLGAAGKFDRILQEADGSYVIGDIKTAGNLDLGAHDHAVQLAVYATADYVQQGGNDWERMPPVRADYAVIVHVDRETGATAIYRVSLTVGRHGTNLAEEIRGWRKSGPVLLPYVPPAEVKSEQVTYTRAPQQFEQHDVSTLADMQAGRQVFIPGAPIASDLAVTPFPVVEPEMNGASNVASSTPATVPGLVADDFPSNYKDALRAEGLEPGVPALALRTAQDLLGQRVTKAHVQEYARQVDPQGVGKDLAHNKRVLVEMLGKAGKLAAPGTVSPPTTPTPAPVMPSAATDTAAFRELTLARIRQAPTIGDLQVLNRAVVKERGDQAWTDEMTEAARLRVQALDTQVSQNLASMVTPAEPTVLDRVAACTETAQLAELWNEITIGGSVMARWTPEVDQASRMRLAELNNARPAPANPFAS